MFSSGLFGFCCSRHWDSAHFCAPASLKGTHVLHTQMCPYSPKPQWHRVAYWREWALRGRSGGQGQLWLQSLLHLKGHCVTPSVLKGIPCSWLKCGVLRSQLRVATPVLPRILLQLPGQEGVGDWEGENGGKCGAVGSGLSQFCASHVPRHVTSVSPGAPGTAPLPSAHFGKPSLWTLGVQMHPVIFSGHHPHELLSPQTPQLAQSLA